MWEPVSHYRSQLWGGSLRVACAPPGVRTGMSINSGGPLRLPAQPHIGSNTYEATGVKRVNCSSPVLGHSTGAWFRSSFIHHPQHARGSTFAVDHLRACDGSDTYAKSAAPHDLAMR